MTNQEGNQPLAPFSCSYSSHVPEILQKLNCSLAISTYQAGKVVCISAQDDHSIIQLPRTFPKPIGMAKHPTKDKLAVACKDEVVVLANSPGLAEYYPGAPKKYDALYMPRATFHTGPLDIHDLSYGNEDDPFSHTYPIRKVSNPSRRRKNVSMMCPAKHKVGFI